VTTSRAKLHAINPDWAKLPLFDRAGWKTLPFGAFAESIGVRVEPADAAEEIYVGLDDLDSGNLHIRRWGKGSDVTGTKLRFRKGDIIFGRRRAYQRKLAVAEFDGICSAHAMVVRAKTDKVLPEFLPFLMMSDRFMKRAVEISVGSLSPTINWTTLKLETFDLPPLDQQRRIAEILWAVDAAFRSHEQNHDSLVELFQTELRNVYSGRIGHGGIETFQIEALPHGWRMVSVADIARVIRGSSPRPKSDPRYYGGTIPRVMVADITRDKKHILPCIDFLTVAGSKLSRPVTRGTLVLVCSGTPHQVGLPGILATDACIHDGIIGLVDIAQDCRTEWLFHLFRFSQSFMDSAATHGGTFVNLTTDIVKGIQFGLPSPEVQDAHITGFEKLELNIANCKAAIESHRNLQQSLLNSIS